LTTDEEKAHNAQQNRYNFVENPVAGLRRRPTVL